MPSLPRSSRLSSAGVLSAGGGGDGRLPVDGRYARPEYGWLVALDLNQGGLPLLEDGFDGFVDHAAHQG